MEKEKLVENMLTWIPSVHRRFLRGLHGLEISRQQFALLFCVFTEGGRSMKYYGDIMAISKPNLTGIVDKLMAQGLLTRNTLPKDRRIVALQLTNKGQDFLIKQKQRMKAEILLNMHQLSETDASRLNELFAEMQAILHKIQ